MTLRAGLVLLALTGLAGRAAAEPGFRVVVPPNNSVVSGAGVVNVVVEVEQGVEPSALRARLKGAELGPGTFRARKAGGGAMHWTVTLDGGRNAIEVFLGGEGGRGSREARVVFFLTSTAPGGAPRDFKVQPFHVAQSEPACVECHRMKPAPEDVGPPSPHQSTCYGCHARITRTKEVHGPSALWACTKCHDPTSTPARYVTPVPVMPLCFGCHEDMKQFFYGNPYQHGPTATGNCTICHNPHGTDQNFFLKKRAYNLCTTCHSEKTGRHVIAWGPSGQGHPLHSRADPRPGRSHNEFACPSCHNPHAAPAPRLWNFMAVTWLGLCRNCHQRIVGDG